MPLEQISINTGNTVMAMRASPDGEAFLAYAGPFALTQWQMAVAVVNCDSGSFRGVSGISRGPNPPLIVAPIMAEGDFHQTVIGMAASRDTPKWLVVTGAPGPQALEPRPLWGLQVFRYEGGVWRWKGLIETRIERLGTPRVLGNLAFAARPGSTNPPWAVFDLDTLTVSGETFDPPEGEIQNSIDGYTYKMVSINQSNFRAIRQGAAVLPKFCPTDYTKRQQVAAMIHNAINWAQAHPGQQLPMALPTDQAFSDVPPAHQFYQSITSLAMAGIVAGKSECEDPNA